MKILKCEGVYEPEDDSYLMLSIPEVKGRVLDMGSGTGIVGIHYAEKGSKVTFVDINPKSARCTKSNLIENKLEGEVLISDLFRAIRGEFDYCLFNPPYLPSDEMNSVSWTGGIAGNEISTRFILEGKDHCKVMYIIESSLSEIDWDKIQNINYRIVSRITYHLEEIRLVRVERCPP